MRLTLLASLFFLITLSVSGQHSWRKPSSNGISTKKSYYRKENLLYSMTVRGGLTQFFGELSEQDMRSMAGIGFGRAFNKNVGLQLEYSAGKTGGEKLPFFNSYFVTEYNTLECMVKWNLTEQFNRFEPGPVNWFVYGGVGQIWFTSNAFDIDDNTLLRFTNSKLSARNPLFLRWGKPKGPVGIKKTREGILTLGTCIDYELLRKWKIGINYHFYFVRTDKLDATSGQSLDNPEESTSYSNTPNDKFSFLAVFLMYRFGKPK